MNNGLKRNCVRIRQIKFRQNEDLQSFGCILIKYKFLYIYNVYSLKFFLMFNTILIIIFIICRLNKVKVT